jgi:hypothetical protein
MATSVSDVIQQCLFNKNCFIDNLKRKKCKQFWNKVNPDLVEDLLRKRKERKNKIKKV